MSDERTDGAPGAPDDEREITSAQARAQALRILEAVLFAASQPIDREMLRQRLPAGSNIDDLVAQLEAHYANRGVNLVRVAGKFTLRTAPDLVGALKMETVVARKLSRAAIETLSIIAYHQKDKRRGVTRAEIEEIRGVALSRGTLDVLLEAGWIGPGGQRDTPGHPTMWVTTEAFLSHFNFDTLDQLPGKKDLHDMGLLDARPGVSAYSEEGGLPLPPSPGEADEDVESDEIPAAEDEPARDLDEGGASSGSR